MKESLAGLPGHRLLARVLTLVRKGNAVEAEMLAHLGEVDARRLYLEEGCSSMFVYCQRVLHFAEAVAYKRIQAARAVRRHPELLEAVREGRIHVTGAGLHAPKLTPENRNELIRAATHRSADEIRRLLADREPKPDAPATMRRLPTPAAPARRAPGAAPPRPAPDTQCTEPQPRPRREALGGERFAIQFTADRELHEQIQELRALLRHQIPDGDIGKVLARAVGCCSGRSGLASSASAPRPARSSRMPRSAMADPGAVTSLPRSGGP